MSAYSAKSAVDSAVESNLLRELDAIDRQIIRLLGSEVATPAEAREILGLGKPA